MSVWVQGGFYSLTLFCMLLKSIFLSSQETIIAVVMDPMVPAAPTVPMDQTTHRYVHFSICSKGEDNREFIKINNSKLNTNSKSKEMNIEQTALKSQLLCVFEYFKQCVSPLFLAVVLAKLRFISLSYKKIL